MIGSDWDAPGFRLHPLEPHTGPFPERPFLQVWSRHRRAPGDELLIASSDLGLVPFVLEESTLSIAGDDDVTDYHSPLGADLVALIDEIATTVPGGTRYDLHSLPGRAATGLNDALVANGFAAHAEEHEVAAVLELPSSFDQYLADLSKKERHETRRKRRRFEAALGTPKVARQHGPVATSMFAEMHRHGSGDKGAFMTPDMEAFFAALHDDAGAVIDVLTTGDGTPAAAAFAFEDETSYYLYNSAYEPRFADSSPGVVLLTELIATAIEAGKRRFDFLKGDESYKFRLGAVPRPLCRLSGEFDR